MHRFGGDGRGRGRVSTSAGTRGRGRGGGRGRGNQSFGGDGRGRTRSEDRRMSGPFLNGEGNSRGMRNQDRGRGGGRGMRGVERDARGRRGGNNNQGFKVREKDDSFKGIGYNLLKAWSENQDREELLIQLSNNIDAIEELLMRHDVKEDWYTLLVKSFNTAIQCQHNTQKLKKILHAISTTHFLTLMLSSYLDQKQQQGMRWTSALDFFSNIVNIVRQIIKQLPERALNCKVPLRILQSMVIEIEPVSENHELIELIASSLLSVNEAHKIWSERQTAKRCRPSSDKDTPPEDFRELSVIPTVSDLFNDQEPFLRAAITKGVYKDQDHYLDIQFRLMREDFFKPLRNGIQEYRECGRDKKFRSSDIRIYEDVHFAGMTNVNGINHVVQFDVSKFKHVKWDHSKRLLNGNLVCLSNDDFESTLIFATVSFRKTEMLQKGIINVVCHSGVETILKSAPSDTFIMAETMAYYEAVNPILEGLQHVDSDLPMKRYIISCEKVLKPPSYLLSGVRKYDISCLMKSSWLAVETATVSILNTLRWPSAEYMRLNPSQREAAILALTKEISVIQGPPGTGKTYVGLKVMQVLLKNQHEMVANENSDHDPILVVCYTNHALDQFLEGILEFCPDGIIRVGGKSSSDRLEPFNLMNVKKKVKSGSKAWRYSLYQVRKSMDDYAKEIEGVKGQIDSLSTDILGEDVLVNCMSQKHYDALLAVPFVQKKKSKLRQWLNASSKSLMQSLPDMIKTHMTKRVQKFLQIRMKTTAIFFNPSASIVERVTMYSLWLFEYQESLKTELCTLQNFPNSDRDYVTSLYLQSTRPSILNDSELLRVIPYAVFKEMKQSLGAIISEFCSEDGVVEAWVLGLKNECSKQLDDVERLDKFIGTFVSEEEVDDFDDKEESENAKRHRQIFEEEDDEMKNLRATQQVKNDPAFLLNRAKFLGIKEDVSSDTGGQDRLEDDDGFQTVSHKKPYTFSQVLKFLSDDKLLPVKEEEEDLINDVWTLDMTCRFALYKLWIRKYRDVLVEKIENLIRVYNDTKQELMETKMKEDIDILRQAKVIGMTTTGAAKKRAWLQAVGCRIIIVEEAAEVLEAHIVTALNENCKHLILIGDHKQLRPNPTVYEHAKFYGLDVSLFERLVNNDVPHVTLNEQHRMRESISVIMRHIYPSLQDHESVKKYENVRGVAKNIFFIQHEHKEESVKDSMSKSNPFEAEYLTRLCKYFLLQGYEPGQITILATYAGQVFTLKKEMKKQDIKNGVRVTVVDNFQGEENDIILLSLVRSNDNNSTGFLKVDNRVCVALSRAKKGMFAIGNIRLLASQSKLWGKIMQTAEKEDITGDGLPLSCPNHPDEKTAIRVPQDFDQCPEGGCKKKCDFRLDCGHTCHLMCHGYNLQHKDFKCHARCDKKCSKGHACRKKCYQKCGDCKIQIPKLISACGHTNEFPCHVAPKDTDCYSQCETIFPCGHRCEGKCGECKKNGQHKKCQVPVRYFWPCGHDVQVECHFKPSENPCPKVCGEVLKCGHECKGKCSDCLNGAIHVACVEKCKEFLLCGHKCQGPCNVPCPPCPRPCPVKCRHGPCSHKHKEKSCGESCIECHDQCKNTCTHKTCLRKCFEICEEGVCERPCPKRLSNCRHPCVGLCGQLCVCKECVTVSKCQLSKAGVENNMDSQTKNYLLKIPSCKHIFNLKELDNYVMAKAEKNSTEFICCPVCATPIQNCSRYDELLKKRTQIREERKKSQLKMHKMTESQRWMMKQSLSLVQEKDQDLIWFDLRHTCEEEFKTFGRIRAMSCKLKFAFVMSEIRSLEQELSPASVDSDAQKRISALLKVKNHMSSQQIEEYKRDLTRLFISIYSDVLKDMAANHGVLLPESDSKNWIRVWDGLKATKPSLQLVENGMVFVHALEDCIEKTCNTPSVQALLMLKKRLAKKAMLVLNSEDDKMLSELLDCSPASTVKKNPVGPRRLPLPYLHEQLDLMTFSSSDEDIYY